MAEFALGLTKTAVEGTLSRVKSALEEEAKLKLRVQNDLVFITGEFQMMQSFLNVANSERIKNQVVRTWVRQLRDLAFDVEDCVDFVLNLEKTPAWTSWVPRLVFSCTCFPPPLLPLDVAVAEIQQLKARVEDVSQRNTRYSLLSDSGSSSKPSAVVVSSSEPDQLTLPPATGAPPPLDVLCEVWEAAGKMRRDMGDLRKLITNQGNDLEVISLWRGPGDVAGNFARVPHIIREAYNDPDICQQFNALAWVKLMQPFNPDEFLQSLLTQFYASSHRHSNIKGIDLRKKMKGAVDTEDELMQQVSQNKYLVIVEGLSTVVEWDTIRIYLPDSKNGSRIIVSTEELGLGLSCTGEPYQVSELRHFSSGHTLYAFFNKVPGRRSDMSELSWHISRRGVISVFGFDEMTTYLVNEVYSRIMHKSGEFDGIEFERHNWVDLRDCHLRDETWRYTLSLEVFSWRLFLNFHSVNLRAKKIAAVGALGESGVIQQCCKFLQEDDCLLVINGLQQKDDWDLIKETFLSEPIKGCIIVITGSAALARHCVEEQDRAFDTENLVADVELGRSIKGCKHYEIGGEAASSSGCFPSNRWEEARQWTETFGDIVRQDQLSDLSNFLRDLCNPQSRKERDSGVISLWGTAGAGKSALVRKIYYHQILIADHMIREKYIDKFGDFGFKRFSWVYVPQPFDLTDFSWRLLLDFYSDDLPVKENDYHYSYDRRAKETVAVRMKGGHDPTEECCKFLREENCFVVIDGLRSPHDWDVIRETFLSEPPAGCIVVITHEESIAMACTDKVIKVNGLEADVALRPMVKIWYSEKKGFHRSHLFSDRMEKARTWNKEVELVGHREDWPELSGALYSPGSVASVWGIAGLGKSAYVRSFYSTRMLGLLGMGSTTRASSYTGITTYTQGDLYGVTMFSWVDVPYPFNLMDFSRLILMDLLSDDLQAKQSAAIAMVEGQDPIQGCRKFLQEDECLIVINDLRSIHDWDLIKAAFLSQPNKSRIVVITNDESFATNYVHDKNHVVNVKGLQADTALQLFRKIAWGSKQLTPKEKEFSELTVAKCGGLPKVIAAIGECCRQEYNKLRFLEEITVDFMGILENDPRFHNLRDLFSWMESYFDGCPDSLKPCIFYLPVFPSGHTIRRKRLLRRWIAEGYSRDKFHCSADEDGEKLFAELIKLSIIQLPPKQYKKCHVNGLFLEYIISRPMEDNLVFALEGCCSFNSQRVGQHLIISTRWDRDEIVFKSLDLSRLRSLTVFGEWRSFFISADINMRCLRVLDLEDTSSVRDSDIEQIGKLVPRLKFFSLRGCREITRLPHSLGGMRQLQTLDVKGTSIVILPPAIIKLEKLQYVRAGTSIPSATEDPPAEEAAAAEEDLQASTTAERDDSNAVSCTTLPPVEEEEPTKPAVREVAGTKSPWSNRARDLVVSCSSVSNKLRCRRGRHNDHDNGGGVKVPAAGLGKLKALQTLGVVNVNTSGKVILMEIKKLTLLRKLRVSGINRENWHDLCSVVSAHSRLESLSVHLLNVNDEQDPCSLDDISELPKTLKSLKLYGGNLHATAVWVKKQQLGHNMRKAHFEDLELTVSTQEDIDILIELPFQDKFGRICVKPIEDGQLRYGLSSNDGWCGETYKAATILAIDCGSHRSEIVFGTWIPTYVQVLVVHCSTAEASLEISGLEELSCIKEVWLRGSYSDAVKQHLQHKLDELHNLWSERAARYGRMLPEGRRSRVVLKAGEQAARRS